YDPALRAMPWTRTHLWLVDDDVRQGGATLLRDWVLDHAGIPDEQVHVIPFDDADPASRYIESMRTEFAWREKGHERLDSVLLPLVPDGRLGGIRPCSAAIEERRHPVVEDGDRVTMSLAMLNASRCLAILGLGEEVGGVIERLLDRRTTSLELPAAGLDPLAGELRWYLDESACAFLGSV
ncbi:MAG: 6-phosphogluconolactonase, partial [Phycisphaerales bacterium]|nr:6-phosphogluconolactonase [Phycisphaerales bacterium]